MAETAVEDAPKKSKPKPKAIKPVKPKPKPIKTLEPDPISEKKITFFERLERVPKADWGTRARIRVYRIEPIIDRTRGSQTKYITVYEEPITEEKLKVEHGSGRYRLYLNYKQAAKEDREVDSVEIDILDLNFPPKVPKGDWVTDGRNQKWAWGAPAGMVFGGMTDGTAQAPAQSSGGVVEMVDTIKAVRELDSERGQPRSMAAEIADTIKVVRELTPAAPPAATENGMLNTIVTLITAQMSNQTELQKQQMAAKETEAKEMRDELRAMRTQMMQPKEGGGIGGIKAILGEIKDFLPALKDVFPGVAEIATGGVSLRGRGRPSTLETILESPVVQNVAGPIGQAIGGIIQQAVMQRMNGSQHVSQRIPQNPPPAGGSQQIEGTVEKMPPPTPPPNPRPADIMDFVFINRLPLLKHFALWCDSQHAQEWAGAEFAAWLEVGFGEDWEGVRWLDQMKAANLEGIITALKQHPVLNHEIWAKVQSREAEFREWAADLLTYSPEEEEGEPVRIGVEPVPIDI